MREIEDLDVKDDNNDLEVNSQLRRMELFSQLRLIDKKLESLFTQKAKSNWFKFGDTNSKFFHYVIRWRRLKNDVKMLRLITNGVRSRKLFIGKLRNCSNRGSRLHLILELVLVLWSLNLFLRRFI